jgi:hypothetical protein
MNGSLVNRTVAKRIAKVVNDAKADIDNFKPSGLLDIRGTDDEAAAVINDVVSAFSQP